MPVRIPTTPAMLLVAALWVAVPALGMTGHWFAGLFVSIVLMALLAAVGSAHRGELRIGFLLFPILGWAAVWGVAFALAEHHRAMFAGRIPDFTILGFHPSFAWIVLGYWLGGVAVLTFGFLLRSEEWLPEARWREFRETIARLDAERQGEGREPGR
jgi:hypothetical protein